ncbi:MAG: hypothetical protein ACRELB_20880 [Polyangiaceae bacterium]
MGMISDGDYNKAKAILVKAGSKTAGKSHEKHTQGKGSPEDHGKGLLREARDEFKQGTPEATKVRAACVEAAKVMSISSW